MSPPDRYKPRECAPWPKCSVCGLSAPDVKGTPPKCPDAKRCVRVVTQFPNNKQDVLMPRAASDYEPPPPDFRLGAPPREGDGELDNRPPEEWALHTAVA